ncbi:MAG: InaA protein [Pseudomonadales bacterium]|nr:InaA protein [Pseudomonadales bacterium]
MSNPSTTTPDTPDFETWWQCEGEWVEPPNVRRNGESGVKRVQHAQHGLVYLKKQTNHLYRDLRHPFGRPTVLRERDVIAGFAAAGVTVPRVLFCGARRQNGQWQAILVTHALDGFESLSHWYKHGHRNALDDAAHTRLLHKIGGTLARFHLAGWQHTCLYAKHIFIHAQPEADGLPAVALLDLEKGRRLPSPAFAARRDLQQLRRHSKMWQPPDWEQVLVGHAQVFGRTVL